MWWCITLFSPMENIIISISNQKLSFNVSRGHRVGKWWIIYLNSMVLFRPHLLTCSTFSGNLCFVIVQNTIVFLVKEGVLVSLSAKASPNQGSSEHRYCLSSLWRPRKDLSIQNEYSGCHQASIALFICPVCSTNNTTF